MASYVISTDTSCDFPLDYVQRHQIPLVSLYYSIDGKDGVNGCPKSEELKTFYQKMREGAETKTQQASVEDTEKLFRQILETGQRCPAHRLFFGPERYSKRRAPGGGDAQGGISGQKDHRYRLAVRFSGTGTAGGLRTAHEG